MFFISSIFHIVRLDDFCFWERLCVYGEVGGYGGGFLGKSELRERDVGCFKFCLMIF